MGLQTLVPRQGTTLRPRSRSGRAHGPQGQKPGCVPHGLSKLGGLCRRPQGLAPAPARDHSASPEKLGEIKEGLKGLNKTLVKVQQSNYEAHLLCITVSLQCPI